MKGGRYIDWTHIRVEGDRDAAVAYVGEARKLLGAVMEDAEVNGLGVHSMHKTLPDGTVIIAEKHGDIPRMTIVVRGPDADEIEQWADDFVVWARDETRTDGIDDTYPQQVLTVGSRRRTLFYNSGIDGYDDLQRPKGAYQELLPGGLRRAGNVDWLSPRGERISWYGPSGRVFTDPYVQPQAQFGKFVFMLGAVLLDVAEYIAESDEDTPFPHHWVMGAALRSEDGQRWLYTVQADLPVMDTPMDPVPGYGIYFSEQYPWQNIPLMACRYVVYEADVPGAARLRVSKNSREVLWSATLPRAAQPWFFNPAGTAATSFSPPQQTVAAIQDGALVLAPDQADVRHTLDLSGEIGGLTSTNVLLPSGSGTVASVARDWDKGGGPVDLLVRRQTEGSTNGALVFVLEGTEWPLHSAVRSGGTTSCQRRWLVHADLPERTVVFLVEAFTFTASEIADGSLVLEVWRRGVRVGTAPVEGLMYTQTGLPPYTDTLVEPDQDLYGLLLPSALTPSWAIYGVAVAIQFTTRLGAWVGAAGVYAYVASPAENVYGSFAVAGASPTVPTPVASWSDSHFGSNQQDADGYFSAIGCATIDDTTLFSGPPYRLGDDESINWMDGDTLPAATGVGGTNARFHPIWRLGNAAPITQL